MSRVEGGNLSSQEADVGILRQKTEDDDHDTLQPDENVKKTTSSSRLDVYNALQNAKFVGSSYYTGKARGSIGALPSAPGLFVHDIGRISLPITNEQSKSLKANSWKTNDDGMLLINKILYLLYTNVLD
jgi:hypothetical protein